MPRFRVMVMNAGRVERKEIEAPDIDTARQTVGSGGARLLDIARVAEPGRRMAGAGWKREAPFPLMLFSRELVSLLEAGLNTAESLEILWEKADRAEVRATLDTIRARIGEGRPLSAALATDPRHFPPLFVAVVASSEQTGQLASALRRFLEHESRLAALKKQMIGALLYPCLVLAVGLLVVVFMLFYVIPKFAQLLASSRGKLSFSAELMLSWSDLVGAHGTLLATAAVLLLGALAWSLSMATVRARLIDVLCRLPKVGTYRTLFELTRFYSAFGLVLDGGIPVPEALRLVGSLLGPGRASALERSLADLGAGQPLSTVLARHGLTTVVAGHLLRIGEHTGEIGRMCGHIVLFQDEELERANEIVTKVFGPVVMLAVGMVVGFLVVMLYLPIFELAGGLGA